VTALKMYHKRKGMWWPSLLHGLVRKGKTQKAV
jgi:hypothetical protein